MVTEDKLISDIEKIINLIDNTDDINKKSQLLNDARRLILIIKNIFDDQNIELGYDYKIEKASKDDNKKTKVKYWNNNINNINITKELSNSLILNYKKLAIPKVKYSLKRFNQKEAYDIIYSFINFYDKTQYKFVKDMLENNLINYKAKYTNNDGLCSYISSLNKSYITMINNNKNNQYNTFNISCIVHELGHAINFNNLGTDKFNSIINSNNIEIPAITLEKLFLDYTIENKIDIKGGKKAIIKMISQMIDSFAYVYAISNYSNYKFDDNNLPKLNYEYIEWLKITLKNLKIDSELSYDLNDYKCEYKYALGYLFAIAFSQMYKDDKKNMKTNYNDFINDIGNVNDFNIFNNYGFNKDDIIKCKALKKEIKSL